jgi:hypothetical protein
MRVVRPMSFCFALAVCLLLIGGRAATAQSQAARPAEPSLAKAEAALAAIENGLGQIERSRRITEQFNTDTALENLYQELRQNYDSTMKAISEDARRAEEATRSGAKAARPGPGDKLEAWERQMGVMRGRAEKIINRLSQINLGLRDGSILIAPELLKKMPAEEVQELRQWLTPEAIRKHQALDKTLFPAGAAQKSPFPPPALTAGMTMPGGQCPACRAFARPRPQEHASSLFDELGDMLVPEADAALAVTCVGTCRVSPPACIPCIIAAVGVTSFLATQLDAGFKGCDSNFRTRLGRAVCKAGVVLAFLTVIA